jgi:hypothetical protein
MYTKKHVGKKQITWRCVKSNDKCVGSLKTDLGNLDPVPGVAHNTHLADVDVVDAARCRSQMRERAAVSMDKPSQIVSTIAAQQRDDVNVRMQSRETTMRVLRNVRSRHRPRDPSSLDELIITGQWTQTTGENPKPFLTFDNGTDAEERILVFATEKHLQQLAMSDSWFMDGTFGVAPTLFSQLYVIHGKVGVGYCPLVYAILQRQTKDTYTALFQYLQDICNAGPSYIIVDFEKAVHQSIREVFGDGVTIRGCFYHLTQATWRKVQGLGLVDLYRGDEEFRLFCGQLDALALLPPSQVREGMAYLKGIAPDAAIDLVTYFDSTYVSGPLRKRAAYQQGIVMRLRRSPPLFPPEVWNVHDATMTNESRTNNVCEGWNNGFSHLIGHDHPTIWKLIEALQKEESRVRILTLMDERGVQPKKRVRTQFKDLQSRLYNLCCDLTSTPPRKNLSEFLRGVSHNIRCGQPYV